MIIVSGDLSEIRKAFAVESHAGLVASGVEN